MDVRLLEEGPPEATNSALDTAEQQKLPARRKSILKQPSVIPASRGPVSSNQVTEIMPGLAEEPVHGPSWLQSFINPYTPSDLPNP